MPAEGDGEILEFGDPAVAEARRAHHDGLHRLVHVPADQQLQRGAVDVLGQHHQRPVRALGGLDAWA